MPVARLPLPKSDPPRILDDDAPPDGYPLPGAWRPIPRSESNDPAREQWVELLIRDRAAAHRMRLELRRRYWRSRVAFLAGQLEYWERLLRDEPSFAWYARARIAQLREDLELARRSLAAIP
ncbi:MAG: hypothetical protein WHT08_18240 [Bryobacteraceae bacterium]